MSHFLERLRVQAVRKMVSGCCCEDLLCGCGCAGHAATELVQAGGGCVFGSCQRAVEAADTRPHSAHRVPATAALLLDHDCSVALQGIAYRMLPTATLERWLQLQHSSSSPSSILAAAAPAPGSTAVAHQCVLSLLQRAAQEGSKAAGIAAASCAAEATLPSTLHFRAQ